MDRDLHRQKTVASQLRTLHILLDQALSADTACHTTQPAHTSPIAYTSPIAHTTSPSPIQHIHQVEEPLVLSIDMEQGISDFSTQQDQDCTQQDHAQQIQNSHTYMQQLRTNNTTLHMHIQDLNMQRTTLQAELDNAKLN